MKNLLKLFSKVKYVAKAEQMLFSSINIIQLEYLLIIRVLNEGLFLLYE